MGVVFLNEAHSDLLCHTSSRLLVHSVFIELLRNQSFRRLDAGIQWDNFIPLNTSYSAWPLLMLHK